MHKALPQAGSEKNEFGLPGAHLSVLYPFQGSVMRVSSAFPAISPALGSRASFPAFNTILGKDKHGKHELEEITQQLRLWEWER